jgi:thiol:disulfide interchange protein
MKTARLTGLWATLAMALATACIWAQIELPGLTFGQTQPVVRVNHFWSQTGARAGDQITLALVLDIQKPYHINSNRAKDPFIPTVIQLVNPPAAIQSSTPIFPEGHFITFGPDQEKIEVFSDRAVIYIPMSAVAGTAPGEIPLQVKVSYQACDDKQCLFPTDTTVAAKLPVVAEEVEIRPINQELFAGMKALKEGLNIAFFGWDFKIEPSKLWLLLLLAAIGGMLLNFTPCVLPLIPIKIIGLSQAAGNRQRCLLLGMTLSLGVVAFWLALATAISSISGFNATNKLFQYPAFTIGVGVIICLMAVGMCGLFTVSLPQWVYRVNPSQESVGGSFLFGIMTAVLSTPCTAPFMGAAAAWAATQQPVITLATFGAIGVGMALPYLILSAFPRLVHKMPRTGPASELIKQIMGLLMLGAGAYFLGTGFAGLFAKPPDPPTDAYWWLVALFVGAAGAWLAWRTLQLARGLGARVLFGGLGLALLAGAIALGVTFTRSSPVGWIYYTPARLAEAQQQGKVVVLEFTAAWCLNCHALEKAVLHHSEVVQLLNSPGVAPVKVDITGNNVEGNKKLIEVGRRTIPYLVIYSREGKELFASDAYTVEQLTQVLKSALSS